MLSKEFDAALAMIDSSRWSRASTKLRVLLVVRVIFAHYGKGVPIGSPVVAAATGMHLRTVRVVLRELVDDGLLVVVMPASGSRGATYEVDPRVSRWRVPWSIEIELVELRLARLCGRLPDNNSSFVRAVPREQQPTARAVWREPIQGSSRDPARTDGWLERAGAREQASSDDAECTFTKNSRSFFPSEEPIERSKDPCSIVMAAIAQRCGQPVLGTLAERIAAALVDTDPAPIVSGISDSNGLRLPGLVALVEQLAAGQHYTPPPTPRPAFPTYQPIEWEEPDAEERARVLAHVAELKRAQKPGPACETVPTATNGAEAPS